MSTIRQWGFDFSIPMHMLIELERRMGLEGTEGVTNGPDKFGMTHSEAYAQSQVVLEAPKYRCMLTRNNKGVLPDKNGTPVRFGMFNETKVRGARLRSWDVVGWRERLITVQMVIAAGGVLKIGQFVGREIKEPGWVFTGTEHELAQLRCTELALSYGCDVGFATGPGSFRE